MSMLNSMASAACSPPCGMILPHTFSSFLSCTMWRPPSRISPAGPCGKEVAFNLLGHWLEKSVLKTLLLVLVFSVQWLAGEECAGEE